MSDHKGAAILAVATFSKMMGRPPEVAEMGAVAVLMEVLIAAEDTADGMRDRGVKSEREACASTVLADGGSRLHYDLARLIRARGAS